MIDKELLYYLNYAFSNENLNTLELPPSALPKRGIFLRLIRYFKGLATELLSLPWGNDKKSINKIIIIYATQNQKKIALELAKNKKPFDLVSLMNGEKEKVNLLIAYIIGLLSLPAVIWFYLTEKNLYLKKSYKYNFDQYLFTYGAIIFFHRLYNKFKPMGVVNSNDHSMINRVSAFVANKMNIKTIYLQHASVTKNFPALNFDAVFLDGNNSLKKYSVDKQVEDNIKIYISGGVSKSNQRRVKTKCIKNILLCTNSLDQISDISDLIKLLVKKNKYNIILRSHPGDIKRKNEWEQLCYSHSIKFSDPAVEALSISFSNADIMISGESNIILDAALVGINSILYSKIKSSDLNDYYGFVENGIALHVVGLDSLAEILDSSQLIDINYDGVRNYDASIGSKNENIVDQLIAEEIYKMVGIDQKKSEHYFYECWKTVSNHPNIWIIR